METKGGFLISRIKQVGGRLFDRMLAEADVDAFNGAQGRILYVLWQQDGLTISQISAQTILANTTLTSMLDRMEKAGLILREPSRTDRRALLIRLTDKARELQRDYDRISQQMNALYYTGFSPEEIRQFEGYLTRVLDNLQGGEPHE
jgi:DNA-binding MarR family transcriptional regulator